MQNHSHHFPKQRQHQRAHHNNAQEDNKQARTIEVSTVKRVAYWCDHLKYDLQSTVDTEAECCHEETKKRHSKTGVGQERETIEQLTNRIPEESCPIWENLGKYEKEMNR